VVTSEGPRLMESKPTKLTKRNVDQIAAATNRFIVWDTELAGFVRIAPTGVKTFILRYRAGGGGRTAPQHLIAIGRYGVLTPDQARKKAKAILGSVARGDDPAGGQMAARKQMTVAELCDRYLKEGVLTPTRNGTVKKKSTVNDDRGRIECHIKPLLGHRRVSSITSADIDRFLVDVASGKTRTDVTKMRQRNPVRGGKGVATRATATLGAIFTFARRQKMRPDNPVHGVPKFAINRTERFLTTDELEKLGAAIREAETTGIPWEVDLGAPKAKHVPGQESRFTKISPYAAAAVRLLLFTGCRLREILHLKWENVDIERGLLFLADSKAGKKTVVLNAPAMAVLASLDPYGPYVVPGDDPEKPRADLKRPWWAISNRAGLEGVRLHDLHHTYASFGAGSGLGLPIIGKLLGHSQAATTARYAHLDNDPVRRAAETIGSRIAAAMDGRSTAEILLLKSRLGRK
jgi:integrase